MPKKKILFVITQGQWGGAQRYVYDLAVNLAKDFDVAVAVGEPNGANNLQAKLGARDILIIQLHHLTRPISPWHDILAIFELAKLYTNQQADIVHLNSSKAGILGSLARLIDSCFRGNDNTKIVYTAHGWVFDEPMSCAKRWFYMRLEKWTAKLKNKIIVLSEKDRQTAKNILSVAENKLAVIPHSITRAEKKYNKLEVRKILLKKIGLNIPESAMWFGSVANFYQTKGLDILLNAVALKKNNFNDTHFLLIGDGPERKNIETMIKQHHLENLVHLTGWMDNAEEIISAFDCLILSSRKEGYPYTILEAVAHEVPIIATEVGGITEMIENKKTGILINNEDAGALSEAIIFALKNPETIKQYANNGFIGQKTNGASDMLQQTISCYFSVINLGL